MSNLSTESLLSLKREASMILEGKKIQMQELHNELRGEHYK